MSARTIRLLAVGALLLGACGGDDEDATVDSGTPAPTVPATAEPPATDPPETEPPMTEPPQTDPPATDPSVTEPSVTEPAATEPPATEPPATEPTATEPTEPPGEPTAPVCVPVAVESGGTSIAGERCDPDPPLPEPRPAAIVLNGCGGYESDDEITAATVRALAERGVIALRVDWLAAEPAPPDTYCDAGAVIGAVQPLLQAVVGAVAELRADPAVDPDRIATASYSLGALAALAAELGGAGLTTVPSIELSAAALLSYPNALPTIPAAAEDGLLPPLLLMTGEDDTVAPPAESQALADAAATGGIPVELVFVPGQDHTWRGEAALAAAAAMAEFVAGQLGT